MQQLFSIPCLNCQDASTECIPSSHSKSSCSRCSTNNLKCVFPLSVRNLPHDKDHIRFSCNCDFCTQSRRQCRFAGPHLSKCHWCIEHCVPCFFTLTGEFHSYYYYYYYYYCSPLYDSSFILLFLLAQGCRNDIKKPSCLLSCDQYSPNTGLAGVSCGTKTYC